MSRFEAQLEKFIPDNGTFIAALDQSGGSTPKALAVYGLLPDAWSSDEEMFALVHAMRSRIMTSPVFNGGRILATILFENTMDREVEGQGTADYLWKVKGIVPLLKVDKGLAEEKDGVQQMKPMPELDGLLKKAVSKNIFGTKMRSVIKQASEAGIAGLLQQQFTVGKQIMAAGLVPVIEPEVDIHCPDKAKAEAILLKGLLAELDQLEEGQRVILKLTPPEQDNLYTPCIDHPHILKVVALSGGYPRDEAVARLAKQSRMVASFSRALVEGLTVHQSEDTFHTMLDDSIESIYRACKT